jgi:hypothetical protein
VGLAGGDVTTRVWLEQREQEIRIPGITAQPGMVVFDDGNAVLKRLSFSQPTTWLSAQLEKDPDLWNRSWVIGQLRQRKSDAEAVQALARAATGADYFLTRVQAAEALDGLEGSVAQTALLAATRDTSSQVRAAAVGSLLSGGSNEAMTRARELWNRDTSYMVRAAALGTLARLDRANARALITTGLETPSYQDAIADAALGVIAESNDSTMIDLVDRAVGTTGNAAFVLALFGARGNARALDLLGQHVTSPRTTVRKRALRAFQFVIPPALARDRLATLAAAASQPRVRSEIQETIDRLKS